MRTEEEIREWIKANKAIMQMHIMNYNRNPDLHSAFMADKIKKEIELFEWVLESEEKDDKSK